MAIAIVGGRKLKKGGRPYSFSEVTEHDFATMSTHISKNADVYRGITYKSISILYETLS